MQRWDGARVRRAWKEKQLGHGGVLLAAGILDGVTAHVELRFHQPVIDSSPTPSGVR